MPYFKEGSKDSWSRKFMSKSPFKIINFIAGAALSKAAKKKGGGKVQATGGSD